MLYLASFKFFGNSAHTSASVVAIRIHHMYEDTTAGAT